MVLTLLSMIFILQHSVCECAVGEFDEKTLLSFSSDPRYKGSEI